ncbi:MAG: peptidylprolyl isomerase [Firmicutes bacterium]|nr:peptidylprolyl isomerase [[Eubacterium] siraeum]MCM1488285.1 peptidylprolyl isomerase [Bacillota bacterium]
MKKLRITAAAMAAALCLSGCSSQEKYMGNTVETVLGDGDVFAVVSIMDYGDITVKLFPEAAPAAVTRFIKFAEDGYYNDRTIHRVVKDQLIQGGSLTGTGFDGNVAKEEYFSEELYQYMCHYYGAMCMAKSADGNYCQFYFVTNNTPVKLDDIAAAVKADLANEEKSAGLLEADKKYYSDYVAKIDSLPDEVKERYAQVGGIYDYDGQDTVFGQVVDGWDVLRTINEVETVNGNYSDDKNDIASRPIKDIVIEKIEVIRIAPAETTTEPAKTKATKKKDETTEPTIIVNDGQTVITTAEESAPETAELTEEEPAADASDAEPEASDTEPEASDAESEGSQTV